MEEGNMPNSHGTGDNPGHHAEVLSLLSTLPQKPMAFS